MAEEGVSGGGGTTNINVGVKVENENAKQAIQNLAKGVQTLAKEFQGVADASGKTADGMSRLGNQAVPALRDTAKNAKDAKEAIGEMATNTGAALLSIMGPMALIQAGLAAFKKDLKDTDDLAKDMERRRQNFGEAGAGRLTADGRLFAGVLQSQLKGTIFGTAEGSQVAAQVAKVMPRNSTPEETAALMKTITPNIAGALGGLQKSAPMLGSAGHVFDLFDKKISPEQATAFAYSLNNAGLIVNDNNKTAIAQLAAAIGPEKALQMAAGATEADVGMKGLFQFATAEPVALDPKHRGPISMKEQAMSLGIKERMEMLARNPEAFGALGTKYAAFGSGAGGPTLAGSSAEFARLGSAAAGDRDAANISSKLQSDVSLQSAKDRDAVRADMRARLSEKLEAYIVSNNLNMMEGLKARTKFDYYDDPLTGIYEAAPGAIGMNAGGSFSPVNKFSRISGKLREAAITSSGLGAVSGETQITARIITDKGNKVSVNSIPVAGGS